MEGTPYIIFMVAFGAVFFAFAVIALNWASNSGQFKELEKGARSIFNEDEPEGLQTDFFPGKNPNAHSQNQKS